MRMIADAEKGKFDLICTREVSRFARNTVDSLQYTRQLGKIGGVEVYFCNDGIWSLEQDGELRLTIMSAMAQEESKHISERVLAGQRTSKRERCFVWKWKYLRVSVDKRKKKSTDNTYEIIEEEAETVRMIYDLYLSGFGVKAIASKMVELKRKKAKWII